MRQVTSHTCVNSWVNDEQPGDARRGINEAVPRSHSVRNKWNDAVESKLRWSARQVKAAFTSVQNRSLADGREEEAKPRC